MSNKEFERRRDAWEESLGDSIRLMSEVYKDFFLKLWLPKNVDPHILNWIMHDPEGQYHGTLLGEEYLKAVERNTKRFTILKSRRCDNVRGVSDFIPGLPGRRRIMTVQVDEEVWPKIYCYHGYNSQVTESFRVQRHHASGLVEVCKKKGKLYIDGRELVLIPVSESRNVKEALAVVNIQQCEAVSANILDLLLRYESLIPSKWVNKGNRYSVNVFFTGTEYCNDANGERAIKMLQCISYSWRDQMIPLDSTWWPADKVFVAKLK